MKSGTPIMMDADRRCDACRQYKPLSEFRLYYGKRQRVCAACRDERLRQNRNARQRKYGKDIYQRRKARRLAKKMATTQ